MTVNYQHKYLKYKMKYRMLLQIEGGGGTLAENLHQACTIGLAGEVKMLLDGNHDIIDSVIGDKTPLHVACMKGHIDVVKALINGNADVYKKDLDIARENNHSEILSLLSLPIPATAPQIEVEVNVSDNDQTDVFETRKLPLKIGQKVSLGGGKVVTVVSVAVKDEMYYVTIKNAKNEIEKHPISNLLPITRLHDPVYKYNLNPVVQSFTLEVFLDTIYKKMNLTPQNLILSVGSGNGYIEKQLNKRGLEIQCIEPFYNEIVKYRNHNINDDNLLAPTYSTVDDYINIHGIPNSQSKEITLFINWPCPEGYVGSGYKYLGDSYDQESIIKLQPQSLIMVRSNSNTATEGSSKFNSFFHTQDDKTVRINNTLMYKRRDRTQTSDHRLHLHRPDDADSKVYIDHYIKTTNEEAHGRGG